MNYIYNPTVENLIKFNALLRNDPSDTITLEFETAPTNQLIGAVYELTEACPSQVNIQLKGGIDDFSFLKRMPQLSGLSLLIYHDFNFDYLRCFSNLKKLRVSNFRSTRISLEPYLAYIQNLNTFVASNVIKESDLLFELKKLSSLFLSNNSFNVSKINKLPNLKKLQLFSAKLSGFHDIKEVNPSIQFLSISDTKSIENLDFVSYISNLEYLELYKLNLLKTLPSFAKNNKLRRLCIEKTNVNDFFNIKTASNLEELDIRDYHKASQDFSFLLDMDTLNKITIGGLSDNFYQKLKKNGVEINTEMSDYMAELSTIHDL